MMEDAALFDTSFIITGLHHTYSHKALFDRTTACISYPCTSSYAKFEYLRRIGQQIQLAFNTLAQQKSVADAISHVSSVSSRAKRRSPFLAINALAHVQTVVRNLRPEIEVRKALSVLRLQAEELSATFQSRTGLELIDGSGCSYSSMVPSFVRRGGGDRMRWPEPYCRPTSIRCTVGEHVRKINKDCCNKVFQHLSSINRTPEQDNIVDVVRKSRSRSWHIIADDRECQRIGDLIIFLDSLQVKLAVTTDRKDWTALNFLCGVKVVVFSGNPDDRMPDPFMQADAAQT